MYTPKKKASKDMNQKLFDFIGEKDCPTDIKISGLLSQDEQREKSENMWQKITLSRNFISPNLSNLLS